MENDTDGPIQKLITCDRSDAYQTCHFCEYLLETVPGLSTVRFSLQLCCLVLLDFFFLNCCCLFVFFFLPIWIYMHVKMKVPPLSLLRFYNPEHPLHITLIQATYNKIKQRWLKCCCVAEPQTVCRSGECSCLFTQYQEQKAPTFMRKGTVAAYQSQDGCKAISKQFGVLHSPMRGYWQVENTANHSRTRFLKKFTPRPDFVQCLGELCESVWIYLKRGTQTIYNLYNILLVVKLRHLYPLPRWCEKGLSYQKCG